jgi:hypothetical protein
MTPVIIATILLVTFVAAAWLGYLGGKHGQTQDDIVVQMDAQLKETTSALRVALATIDLLRKTAETETLIRGGLNQREAMKKAEDLRASADSLKK